MKKLFTIVAAALMSASAFAQTHCEWTAAQIPQDVASAEAAGFTNMYDGAFFTTTANYTLCEGEGFSASFEKPTLIGKPNSKYPGYAKYNYVPLMGMNNSTRDGIEPAMFTNGLSKENIYVRTNKFNEEVSYTDAIVTMKVATAQEGGKYGVVTLTYSKGDNLSVMYVVDATANNGAGRMVLQSRTRNEGATTILSHVAKFGVEPGHTYYVIASEKQSVELYGLTFDDINSEKYETLIPVDYPVYWTAAQIPQDVASAEAAGFTNMYDGAFFTTTANYTLCEGEGFSASFEKPTLIGKPNSKYPGYAKYNYVPLMGMNNSTRDGIEPAMFTNGLSKENIYVRTNKFNEEVSYTDAIVTMKVATAQEGGKYGAVTLNYSKGDNLSVMYVVDATVNSGAGMMVLQSRTRNEGATTIYTHTAQFGVEPGHTYYVIASEKQSVELYALGYCPVTSGNYCGIEEVLTNNGNNNGEKTIKAIYTIDGAKVNSLQKGLNIIKYSDGTAKKVIK